MANTIIQLKNSGATFQRFMDDIFRDFIEKFLMVYIDDIIVYSEKIEEHFEHLYSSSIHGD